MENKKYALWICKRYSATYTKQKKRNFEIVIFHMGFFFSFSRFQLIMYCIAINNKYKNGKSSIWQRTKFSSKLQNSNRKKRRRTEAKDTNTHTHKYFNVFAKLKLN